MVDERGRARLLVALMPVAALIGGLAASWWFVCDDAFISFRYARHLAEGVGLRFNAAEQPPVEGYSNFLWVLLAALSELVGVRPALSMPLVSVGCEVALMVAVARALVRFGAAPLAVAAGVTTLVLAPGTVVWSTSGLETMAEAALLFWMFDRWVLDDDPRGGALAGLLLSLVRTEGVAWVLVALALAALTRRGRGMGRFLAPLAAFAGVYAVYAAGRYAWFGSLIANTAYVKVDPGLESASRGVDYVVGFWLAALAPPLQLLLGATALRTRDLRVWTLAAMAVGVPLYAVVVGGDFMAMGRLLVPGTAFVAVLVGLAVQRVAGGARVAAGGLALGLGVLGTLVLFDVNLAPRSLRDDFRVRFNTSAFRTELGQWRYMKDNARAWSDLGVGLAAIAQPGDSLVLGAVGAVGYETELFIHDRYGLVSPEVAQRDGGASGRRHSPGHDKYVGVEFFLDQAPTFLRAELVRGDASEGTIGRVAADWHASAKIRERYGPAAYPVTVRGRRMTLIALRRLDDPAAAWAPYAGARASGGRADDAGEE